MKISVLFALLLTFTAQFAKGQNETSILFIGNSFTANNNMPELFKTISTSFNKNVIIDTVIHRGKNIEFQASQSLTYSKIKSRKWDYIVIQGHSDEFAQPESTINKKTKPFANQLIDSIRKNYSCTKILLYMTWGYKNGNVKWEPTATYPKMQALIEKEYLRFSDLFTVAVSPVGSVWADVRTSSPNMELYDPDLRHPSLHGSYLSACTFYATIFGSSPYESKTTIDIPDVDKRKIELSASQIVLNNLNKWSYTPQYPKLVAGYELILSGKEVSLINRAVNFDTISWDFGDGKKSSDLCPKHIYTKPGKYSVVQKVSNGCTVKYITRKIEILN